MFIVTVQGNSICIKKSEKIALIPTHEAVAFVKEVNKTDQFPSSVVWGETTFSISDWGELSGLIHNLITAIKELNPSISFIPLTNRHLRPLF